MLWLPLISEGNGHESDVLSKLGYMVTLNIIGRTLFVRAVGPNFGWLSEDSEQSSSFSGFLSKDDIKSWCGAA